MILVVEAVCYDSKIEEVTGNAPDLLMEVVIDLSAIVAVKEDYFSDTKDKSETTCVVYFGNGEYFIISKPYQEMKKIFIDHKTNGSIPFRSN